jgi:hypothetical protein
MVRAAEGVVQGAITLELDANCDPRELWGDDGTPVGDHDQTISPDMASDYFTALQEMHTECGVPSSTEWLDSGDVQIFAWYTEETGVTIEHTYDSESATHLVDLVGGDGWRWHRGDF